MTCSHQKLVLPASCVGHTSYADFYFHQTPRQIILYLGGAISSSDYAAYASLQDLDVLRVYRDICAESHPHTGLLIIPSPLISRRHPQFVSMMYQLLKDELLATIDMELSSITGIVGYSFGGYLAIVLGSLIHRPLHLAILGGVGMDEPIQGAHEVLAQHKYFVVYGDDDPVAHYSLSFVEQMDERCIALQHMQISGGHRIDEYIGSGGLAMAFQFVSSAM